MSDFTEEDSWTPTPAELAELDARYVAIPDFEAFQAGLSVDPTDVDALILSLRGHTGTDEAKARAIRFAIRAAAWDTGAIEALYATSHGTTISVASEEGDWEAKAEDVSGPDALAHFDAQLNAYLEARRVAEEAAPISEAWIRHLHELACANQHTYRVFTPQGRQFHELPKGEYKRFPNHVRRPDGEVFAYCPVDMTKDEMHRLVSEVITPGFEGAHPLVQATYLHFCLVHIHPFADGNGRVARALASLPLFRVFQLPLVILLADRPSYIDSLIATDVGRTQTLLDFFTARFLDTSQLVLDQLSRPEIPSSTEFARRIREMYKGSQGIAILDYERAAKSLHDLIGILLREFVVNLGEMSELRIDTTQISGSNPPEPPPGWRHTSDEGARSYWHIAARTTPPASQLVERGIVVYLSLDLRATYAFLVRSSDQYELAVRAGEVWPKATSALHLRLVEWIDHVVGIVLSELAEKTESALKGIVP